MASSILPKTVCFEEVSKAPSAMNATRPFAGGLCPITHVPEPWSRSTSPSSTSRDTALRTVFRETCRLSINSWSVGSFEPTGSSPPRRRSRSSA